MKNQKKWLLCILLATILPCASLMAIDLKGKVSDKNQNPLVGVTISVKNKQASSTTGSGGEFSISADANAVLVFSYVGFKSQEVSVGNQTTINITLQEQDEALDQVVVVGYGKGSRKTISSAIVSIKPEDLNRAATGDVGQLLQGKVPGLNITASGDPNRPAAVILRGASTVNSPQGPFYVIDGIPGADINAVAPDDIATIDILKDASATAIYGNRPQTV